MTIIFLAIGLAAGVLSGIFGIGGGIVIVPALLYFGRLTPQSAVGTSLGALLLPVGILGAWSYYQGGNVNVRAAVFIALGLAIGVYFGAQIGQSVNSVTLRRSFSIFLVLVAGKMWFN